MKWGMTKISTMNIDVSEDLLHIDLKEFLIKLSSKSRKVGITEPIRGFYSGRAKSSA